VLSRRVESGGGWGERWRVERERDREGGGRREIERRRAGGDERALLKFLGGVSK
jgi:hypothetical protein